MRLRFSMLADTARVTNVRIIIIIKCLATVPCDLSLPVSNCRLFSDINISQGSVATCLRCGGIFSYHYRKFIAESKPHSERILKIG